MNEYLVIRFDRYDTNRTMEERVIAMTPQEAYQKAWKEMTGTTIDDSEASLYFHEYKQVTDVFGCIAGEEEDLLIYVLNTDVSGEDEEAE